MAIKPFKLERFLGVHEFSTKYLLSSSDCESLSIGELLAFESDATEKFHRHWLGYTEPMGDPELRTTIASIFSSINAEDVLVCSGAEEPIYLFIQTMLKAGDRVIVQSPCYQSVQSIPESLGCEVSLWQVHYVDGKPIFDLGELEQLMTLQPKVLFLNTPHNPTGYHFTKEEQQAIISLARKYGTIILCDEVYRELEHDPAVQIPAIADVYEHGVSIGVLSKAYGLPGLRIGWLISKRKDILEEAASLRDYTTICNSAPSEFLATLTLRNRKKVLDRNLGIVNKNLDLLDIFFEKYEDLFTWYRPNAGPVSFVRMKFDQPDLAFAEEVVQKQQVLLLPGYVFDYPRFFRVGFGRKNMSQSLEQFELFVNQRWGR